MAKIEEKDIDETIKLLNNYRFSLRKKETSDKGKFKVKNPITDKTENINFSQEDILLADNSFKIAKKKLITKLKELLNRESDLSKESQDIM